MKYQFNPYKIDYEKIDVSIYDFKTECILASHKAISKNRKNKPLMVMLSGGLDSEMVARALLLSGISFKCLIGKLQVEVATETITLNEHDYHYAEKWCNSNNIKVEYCSLDIYKDAKLLTEYALLGQGFSPQLAWHMYLMKWCHDNGYFFVGGHEDIDFVLKDGEYFSKDFQRDLSTQNFVDKLGLDGINRFWKQDSRLMASFLKLSTVQQLMKDRVENLVEYKSKYFSEVFPDIEERPKFTGFERVQEWDAILRTYMKKFNLQYNDISYVPASYFNS